MCMIDTAAFSAMWALRSLVMILHVYQAHSQSTQDCEYLSTHGSAMSQTALECEDQSIRGSAMLQKSHLTLKALMATSAQGEDRSVQGFNLVSADAPLTEEGFAAVVETCCQLSFDEYSRRLLSDMDMEICDEGCYNGWVPFFDCKKSTLQEFKQAIMRKSNELCACFRPRGQCPLGGLPKVCLDGNTGKYNPASHRRRICASSSTTRQPQPTPAPLVSTTVAIITKPTCAEYVCQQAGWTKKSGADDLNYPSDSTCCEPTCKTYQCLAVGWVKKSGIEEATAPSDSTCCEPTCKSYKCLAVGWVKKSGIEDSTAPRDEICCEETCLAYSCQNTGWVKKSGMEHQTIPNDDVCCSATCSSYTCQAAGWVMQSGVEDLINPDDGICCEATCGSYTCKSSGWMKKRGVERTVDPSDYICCEGPNTTVEITTITSTITVATTATTSTAVTTSATDTATSTIARKITIATSTTSTTVTSTSTTTTTTTQHKSLLECGLLLSQVQTWCNESLACNEAENWLLQCAVEACNAENASEAQAVAAKYNTCGDPEESCDSDFKSYAKNACYTAINDKCSTASPDLIDDCVADVCAASQSGDPSPLDIATDYCDFILGPDDNDTSTNSSNTTEGNLSEALCSGTLPPFLVIQNPTKQLYMTANHSKCVIPVSKSICEERILLPRATASKYLPSQDSPRPENGTDLPHGCIYTTQYKPGENLFVWNENPGGIQGTPFKAGSVALYCCDGGVLGATTTTTTREIWVPWEPPNCDNPAPRPISPSPSPVVIERPADAKYSFCSLYGDPHIKGFATWTRLPFYRHGHFWVVRSSSVWIQAHYGSASIRRPQQSTVRRLAIGGPFLLGNTILIDSGFRKMWWNDQSFSIPFQDSNGALLGEDLTFTAMDGAVKAWTAYPWLRIEFPNDSIKVLVRHRAGRREKGRLAQIQVDISMLQISGQDGHCGDFNGKYLTKAVDDGQDLLANCN